MLSARTTDITALMETSPTPLTSEELDATGRRLIYVLTTAASVLLLWATRATQHEWAWFEPPALRAGWYAFAISMPLTMALLWVRDNGARTAFIAAGTLGLLTALAAFVGADYAPALNLSLAPIFATFIFSISLAWFVAMPYLQGLRDTPRQLDYPALFRRAWDNLLTLLTGHAFTLLCWLILWLSAGLFNLVGLDFLQQLLQEDSFYFPATGLLLGFGLTLGRSHLGAIRSVLRICLSFSQVLLPAVSAITVLFAVALLLSDLTPLWATGHATFLLLSLIYLVVALVNGVYTDGQEDRPYARPVTGIVIAGLLVLPALAAIAAYAMSLRVGQYGLTVSRLYGIVAIGFGALYAASYAVAALRGMRANADWLPGFGTMNRALGALLVLVLILSQSPGLNFRERALAYQLKSIDLTTNSPGETDWMYLRFELGRPGYSAVQKVAEQAQTQGLNNLAAHLQMVLEATHPYDDRSANYSIAQLLQDGKIRVLPEGIEVPQDLPAQMATLREEIPMFGSPAYCSRPDPACMLIAMELNRTPPQEWVLIPPPEQGCEYPVFTKTNDNWTFAGYLRPDNYCINSETYGAIAAGRWSTLVPAYDNLQTGPENDVTIWRFQPR